MKKSKVFKIVKTEYYPSGILRKDQVHVESGTSAKETLLKYLNNNKTNFNQNIINNSKDTEAIFLNMSNSGYDVEFECLVLS